MDRLLQILEAVNGRVARVGRAVAAGLLLVMLVVVLVQVVFRYLLNNSLSWSEEVAKVLMIWLTLLVAPWAYRTGLKIRIGLFRDVMPWTMRHGLDVVLSAIVFWILGVLLIESFDLVTRGLEARASTVPVPTAVFYAILPVGFLALMAVAVEQGLLAAQALRLGPGAYPDPDQNPHGDGALSEDPARRDAPSNPLTGA